MLNRRSKATLSLILFVLPAFTLYAIFLVIPMVQGSYYSFTNWDGLNKSYSFVGLQNFVEAIRDDANFRTAILFTAKYVLFAVILQNALALLLALLIESQRKAKGFFRTIFFMPNMLSVIISTFMWVFVFSKVMPALSKFAALKFLDLSWLGRPEHFVLDHHDRFRLGRSRNPDDYLYVRHSRHSPASEGSGHYRRC